MQDRKKVVGYVRLSRDDDKKNYVSIENQKLLIEKYADSHDIAIDAWYEDDGYSGYKFDRPAFSKLIDDMDIDVDTVIAKDLSRIGRHNAKVLILLEEFKERGKRLIIIDDKYDTLNSEEDDIIGIKTWVNEKYIKDTSKKIKSVLRTRQMEGTLIIGVPVGYRKRTITTQNEQDSQLTTRTKIEIIPWEAEYIRIIFDLYLQGNGYRKIANILTDNNVPTPSMIMMKRYIAEGKIYKRKIAYEWNDGMVAAILKNDFYIGNLRLHKRARIMINGRDNRIPKEKQLLFENNHPSIIDKRTFDQVQDIMHKRVVTDYREILEENRLFSGKLFCKDCGGRLTPITRRQNTTKKYYICNTYNNKGKRYCSHAHMIDENILVEDVLQYLITCRDTLGEMINNYNLENVEEEVEKQKKRGIMIESKIASFQRQLDTLLKQKIKEITDDPDNADLIRTSFHNVQQDLIKEMNGWKRNLIDMEETELNKSFVQHKCMRAVNIFDAIIKKESIDREDIEIIIEKIIIDQKGMPDIELKNGINSIEYKKITNILNQRENEILITIMKLIYNDKRCYTSVKYLSNELAKRGYVKSKKEILSYINICIEDGVLKPTDEKLKPYEIIVSKEELAHRIQSYINQWSAGWYATDGI